MTDPDRVAVYLRVSTLDQRERRTIDGQRHEALRHCAAHGLAVHDVYTDDGISGALAVAERPGGGRLLADAEAGRFGAVVVYRLDRFGRSMLDLLQTVERLDRLGVGVRSLSEPIQLTGALGRFMLGLLAAMAELERETIKERMLLGRERLARAGKWAGGTPPLGYRPEGGYLVEDPEHAELVRWMFTAYSTERRSLGWIARRLNAEAIPTSAFLRGRGGAGRGWWSGSKIRRILTNRAYVGEHDYRAGRPDTIARSIPPLVSSALFDLVQHQLGPPAPTPTRVLPRAFLLAGLIRCGRCGSAMVGTSSRDGRGPAPRRRRHHYRCSSDGRIPCDAGTPRAEVVELVAGRLVDLGPDATPERCTERIRRVVVQARSDRSARAFTVDVVTAWSERPVVTTVRSIPEAGRHFGRSGNALRGLIARGRLDAIRVGHHVYVLGDELSPKRCPDCDGIVRGRGASAVYCLGCIERRRST